MSQDVHRFMAFAFASADLLIELDADRRVAFALGATTGLVDTDEPGLIGRAWEDLFAAEDRGYATALIEALQPATRCGPVLVRLETAHADGGKRDAMLCACRLPAPGDRIGCTLSQPHLAAAPHAAARRRDRISQLIDAGAFSAAAIRLADTARAIRKPAELTFLDLPALDDATRRLPAAQAEALVARIGALLRAASIDGASAAALGPGRFGLVHDPAQSPDALATRIAEAAEAAAIPLEIRRSTLDLVPADLPADGAVRAIRYAVETVARDGIAADTPDTLLSAFDRLVAATLSRVDAFARGVRDASFALLYQPIACLETGVFSHFEVLTRFAPGESPAETIRFAEETGLIERFDLAVLARACALLADKATDRRVALAVNVSARSLDDSVFVRCLLELLDAHPQAAARLAIEITESARLEDPQATDAVLREIRRRGFRVCLDDFGAGAAGFSYLQALAVDYVKIDGAYVDRLGRSAKDDAMIRGLVRLCDELGIVTIGERVETRAQADTLRRLGVKYGQGWFFGKPMAAPIIPWDFAAASA
jgi:EAL domain-containing protein (putative c-di-GMP-specific phosphodiesterase class I)